MKKLKLSTSLKIKKLKLSKRLKKKSKKIKGGSGNKIIIILFIIALINFSVSTTVIQNGKFSFLPTLKQSQVHSSTQNMWINMLFYTKVPLSNGEYCKFLGKADIFVRDSLHLLKDALEEAGELIPFFIEGRNPPVGQAINKDNTTESCVATISTSDEITYINNEKYRNFCINANKILKQNSTHFGLQCFDANDKIIGLSDDVTNLPHLENIKLEPLHIFFIIFGSLITLDLFLFKVKSFTCIISIEIYKIIFITLKCLFGNELFLRMTSQYTRQRTNTVDTSESNKLDLEEGSGSNPEQEGSNPEQEGSNSGQEGSNLEGYTDLTFSDIDFIDSVIDSDDIDAIGEKLSQNISNFIKEIINSKSITDV